MNPFRYRGYYYDTETGFYYLQSRYYNPEWGRFLNADVYVNANGDLVGFNMYAYCSNNPVSNADYYGNMACSITEPFQNRYRSLSDHLEGACGGGGITVAHTTIQIVSVAKKLVAYFSLPAALIAVEVSSWVSSLDVTNTKDDASNKKDDKYNYWAASIVGGQIVQGSPLTYSQAREWVAAEKNLLCRNHAAAIAIVKFYPSASWDEAHGGGIKCGYLNHYHLNSGHTNHIWYYGE